MNYADNVWNSRCSLRCLNDATNLSYDHVNLSDEHNGLSYERNDFSCDHNILFDEHKIHFDEHDVYFDEYDVHSDERNVHFVEKQVTVSTVTYISFPNASFQFSIFKFSINSRFQNRFDLLQRTILRLQQNQIVIYKIGRFVFKQILIFVFCFDDQFNSFFTDFLGNFVDSAFV